MEPVIKRSRIWTHAAFVLAGFILGLAVAQWNSGYAQGHSRVAWPGPSHARQLEP